MNLNLVFCLIGLLVSTLSIHLQHQEIYRKEEYQEEMLQTQDRFKSDLQKIRLMYQTIDNTLLQ